MPIASLGNLIHTTRVLFAGSEEPAQLAERAALLVLQRRTSAGEGGRRAHGLRRLFPGRPVHQAVRPRSAETTASRQRVDGRRSRGRLRYGLRRRRQRRLRRSGWRLRRRRRWRGVGWADRQEWAGRRTVQRQVVLAVEPRHRSGVVVGSRRLRPLAGLRERTMTTRRYYLPY